MRPYWLEAPKPLIIEMGPQVLMLCKQRRPNWEATSSLGDIQFGSALPPALEHQICCSVALPGERMILQEYCYFANICRWYWGFKLKSKDHEGCLQRWENRWAHPFTLNLQSFPSLSYRLIQHSNKPQWPNFLHPSSKVPQEQQKDYK